MKTKPGGETVDHQGKDRRGTGTDVVGVKFFDAHRQSGTGEAVFYNAD